MVSARCVGVRAGRGYFRTASAWFDWLQGRLGKALPRLDFQSSTEPDDDRVLVAILITDIVDSTKWVAEKGDRDWRVLLDRHYQATRYQMQRFSGRKVGSRGDGFVGIFTSPARAIRCAAAIAERTAPLGISLRCGIHVGEVHLKRGEISGIAVHTAARIAAKARPGEAFVSKTVRDLVTGSQLTFEDRGLYQLRGVPEEIRLYAVATPCLTDRAPVSSRRAVPDFLGNGTTAPVALLNQRLRAKPAIGA